MNDLKIDEILKTKRLHLKGKELINHYLPVCLFLTVPLADIYFLIESKLNKEIEVEQRIIDGFNLVWIFLVLAIVTFIIKYWSLKFKIIESTIDFSNFKRVINVTSKELNWSIITQNDEYIVASANSGFFGFGERVTIVKFEKFILINSICNPESRPAILSQGGNEKNIQTFTRNIKASA